MAPTSNGPVTNPSELDTNRPACFQHGKAVLETCGTINIRAVDSHPRWHPSQMTLQGLPFKVNEVGAVLVPFQVPLKPGGADSDCPAGMVALYETLVIVTVLPLWV